MGIEWFRRNTEWNDFANRKQYDAPADPWKLLRVSPTNITHLSVAPVKWGLGRVHSGDWDKASNLTPVTDIPVYRGLRQRFEDGFDWEETAYFEMAETRIEEHGQFRGYDTVDEFLQTRCPEIETLYENIRQEGYRPNRGTVYTYPTDAESIHDLEPMVLIGRSGEVYWTEGFTRLTVAKLLNVTEIPVYALQRHEEWQQIRDRISNRQGSELESDLAPYVDHPDIPTEMIER